MTFIGDICLSCKRPIDDAATVWDPDSRLFICCCREVAPDEMRSA